jgi:phosphoribosylanthranilate isomerase
MPVTRVKICCVRSSEEARLAVEHGAAAIGLVSEMPSGPGVIAESLIAEIASALPPAVASFLLTSRVEAEAIVAQARRCRVNTVQLCDRVPVGTLEQVRHLLPGVSIVQVVHVRGEEAIDEALDLAPHVNGLLLDSGDPEARVKELGGTGRTHDWAISRRVRDRVGVPVFLAGGLTPANVAEAIRRVAPYGVDVCTGVRTGGRLDHERLLGFVRAVRGCEA